MSLKIRGIVALAGLAAATSFASAASYIIDDGISENSVGLTATTTWDSVWLNTFSLTGGDNAISSVSIQYGFTGATTGQNLNGRSATVLIYTDPTGGTPWDATLVYSAPITIANFNTNTFNTYAVPNVPVGTNFVVGFQFTQTQAFAAFPAGFDQTAPTLAGRSFAGFLSPVGAGINPANLNAIPTANRNAIEAFGLVGNWTIRAEGVPTPGAAGLLAVAGLAGLRRRR